MVSATVGNCKPGLGEAGILLFRRLKPLLLPVTRLCFIGLYFLGLRAVAGADARPLAPAGGRFQSLSARAGVRLVLPASAGPFLLMPAAAGGWGGR